METMENKSKEQLNSFLFFIIVIIGFRKMHAILCKVINYMDSIVIIFTNHFDNSSAKGTMIIIYIEKNSFDPQHSRINLVSKTMFKKKVTIIIVYS